VIPLIFLWFGLSVAEAGAPPSDAIPWDTMVCVDTMVTRDGEIVIQGHTVLFITRDKYEREVLGFPQAADAREIAHDLEVIKKLIKTKKKKP